MLMFECLLGLKIYECADVCVINDDALSDRFIFTICSKYTWGLVQLLNWLRSDLISGCGDVEAEWCCCDCLH